MLEEFAGECETCGGANLTHEQMDKASASNLIPSGVSMDDGEPVERVN